MSDRPLSVLIVDDERPARERLERLLAGDRRLAVTGHAEDGEQAMDQIVGLRPDIVFLDIQMPG
ncbi:MAG TPA: response regulator, partial [Candidatus Polarisedimenticolaceae bacterium]|nr:response regulator [Candidatus Polarisedimenticolaceae bacterium]